MPTDKREIKTHPSYGAIKVSRISGTTNLFGSDVKHGYFIEVSIHECEVARDLSNDWYHSGKEFISVWMSELQWAQFVSSFNQGEGTPVTLRYVNGKRMPELPEQEKITSKFQKEVKDTAKSSLASLQAAIERLKVALVPKAKTPTKAELGEMLSNLESSFREFTNGLPFIEEQFVEQMEHKMSEAKTAFEGYVSNRLRALGVEGAALAAAKAEAPQLSLPESNRCDHGVWKGDPCYECEKARK